ncbi:alpha/beta hydrolase [Labedaea rhizosphaerae]|uniref:Acetyl esterase/lipase n=1 Tax=Labedaea rhizosphaerae TaxID=598644 RepID=A0A4R6S591_LABRH|nr:alpha/beta hydrolase [Labedaea rhizosphaerae]TDP94912.1 acetyl esterase/lipase [Labedaea rhizosphaerae]
MSEVDRPPLGVRLLRSLGKEPDWSAMTAERLEALAAAENRKRASTVARVITGRRDRGAAIRWREVGVPGRTIRVREYRPKRRQAELPLVVHVHGGAFVGTAVQSDWVNSHLAARLPAVVVSVEHRLLAPGTSLAAAADDVWEVLRHLVGHAADWGVDPERAAVFGESAGAMMSALAALRARAAGLRLRAQVLVNPAVDVTDKMFDHESVTRYANSPTLTVGQMELFARLAVPAGADAREVSPLHADDLSGLAPALVVVPTLDPVADHGRAYAELLHAAGTPVRRTELRGATHAFLSMPSLVPQAKAARAEITAFLRERLHG